MVTQEKRAKSYVCTYKGFAGDLEGRLSQACVYMHKNVSDGVVKDGDKARCQEFEKHVFLCSQSSNIPRKKR